MEDNDTMDMDKLVSWIVDTKKRQIDGSCHSLRKKFFTALRDNPEEEIVVMHSNISDWKIRAHDETGQGIEDFDENEDLKISQDVIYALKRIFSDEIEILED
jgi:hypothetical protein